MKYTILLPLLALSACVERPVSDCRWMNECDKHFSYDSRENARCKERQKTIACQGQAQSFDAGTGHVTMTPRGADMPTEEGLHKDKAD